MKHTRLITLLLISFIMLILAAGCQTDAVGIFSTVFLVFGTFLVLLLPLAGFISNKLSVQLRN